MIHCIKPSDLAALLAEAYRRGAQDWDESGGQPDPDIWRAKRNSCIEELAKLDGTAFDFDWTRRANLTLEQVAQAHQDMAAGLDPEKRYLNRQLDSARADVQATFDSYALERRENRDLRAALKAHDDWHLAQEIDATGAGGAEAYIESPLWQQTHAAMTQDSEKVSAFEALCAAMGAHILADGYRDSFPDNEEDGRFLRKNETFWRLTARSWLPDAMRSVCSEMATRRKLDEQRPQQETNP